MPETNTQPAILSHFVSRVASLPAVMTALDTAKQSYNSVKDRNGLIGFTLTRAERTANFAVGHTLPVLEKIAGGPIQYVDNLACKGLDKIEEAYPGLKNNQPEKILQDAVSKYQDVRQYGVNLLRDGISQAVQALVHPREALSSAYDSCAKKTKAYTLTASREPRASRAISVRLRLV